MKKDLKGFKKSKKGSAVPDGIPRDAAEDFARKSKRYEGKSEDELMGELLKHRGEISEDELLSFERRAGAMLSADQKKKLKAIMSKLK